jgi:hypothetical protein
MTELRPFALPRSAVGIPCMAGRGFASRPLMCKQTFAVGLRAEQPTPRTHAAGALRAGAMRSAESSYSTHLGE